VAAPTVHLSGAFGPGKTGTEGTLHVTVMGPNVFATHPLPVPGTVTIGREEEADVRLVDESASRKHARMHVEAGPYVFVEDLGTPNGTFVRDSRLAANKRVPLQLGEAVTIGFTTLMVQRRRPPIQPRRFRSHGAFEELLEDACVAATSPEAKFALLRLRIDGDVAGGRVADLITPALREGDARGQYANGDYEILLLDTAPERARAIADDLSARIRAEGLVARSVVAVFPADGRTAEALIGRSSALLRGAETEDGGRSPVLKSDATREVYRLAGKAAKGQTANGLINILILGETGVGKDVLAKWIHRHSPCAEGPYRAINCGALTETLLDSELFGYEKGAFTGAQQAKAGLLESAQGGTVFLDEIGDMPDKLQVKLLRTIENREITRVGGTKTHAIDVRFMAATHRDLDAAVEAKTFREDLYYRLNSMTLTLPPLRERPEEIEALARQFLAEAAGAGRDKRRVPRISAEALAIMRAHSWRGNIRELRNVVEHALVLCEDAEITAEHLPVEKMRFARLEPAASLAPQAIPLATQALPPQIVLSPAQTAERAHIVQILAECAGNQTRAAKMLAMSRGTLISRMKRYGIPQPRPKLST
jgi:DNA-binding NtrC family response regulator/pSer/pThr/pTyr-binding forkhead associated (FHA) protein